MPDLLPGRRKAVTNEHLFLGPTRKHVHVYLTTQREHSGPVVACGVCGRIKRGQTLPAAWAPITRP